MREITYHLYSYGAGTSNIVYNSKDYKDLAIYPNPVESQLFVEMIRPVLQGKIYNMDGKSVWSGQITEGIINVTDLADGVYILRIEDESFKSIRFVKST